MLALVRSLIALTIVLMLVFVAYRTGYLDRPLTTKEAVEHRKEENKITANEIDIKCLGLGIWHGANKGKESDLVKKLIGYTYKNAHKEGHSYCAIFELCLEMMPQSWAGSCTRDVQVVSAEQYLGTARIRSAIDAETLARQIIEEDPQGKLPANLEHLACVRKFTRSFVGLFWAIGGLTVLDKLRNALEAEMGPPVYTEKSDVWFSTITTFYCPKKATLLEDYRPEKSGRSFYFCIACCKKSVIVEMTSSRCGP